MNPTPSNPHGQAHTNHLIHEKSPYLLMHAHNPVEWYPWAEEAFDRARRENKPIFLSVGYSTCHWCHVMERESFQDPEIAAAMNRDFINIKVDREERPDVDRVYMTFVQATTGGGGWPMSVFLTPRLKPFFGGTYWPPHDLYGRPGFTAVLDRVAAAWSNNPQRLAQSADELTAYLEKAVSAATPGAATLQPELLDNAYRRFQSSYDPAHGGFGEAPKFPRPVVFNFLLRYQARTGSREALEMTLGTLRAMAAGGIHDHLGGGFHRYAVDAHWHVPHFEKMLYDQAQLAVSYLEAYQITHERFYADTARDILDYVLRDMRSPEGGFYTAEDADSLIEEGKPEHGEGAFYVWTAREIETALSEHEASVFAFCFDVRPDGNVPPDRDLQGEFRGKNVLRAVHSLSEAAKQFGRPETEIAQTLSAARTRLLAARDPRPRPLLDDKILASWNGLMISAFARAAQIFDDAKYLDAARRSAAFLKSNLHDPEAGTLKRRYRAGQAAIGGFLDDYAFLIQGLLDLYEASFEVAHLIGAIRLQEKQDQLFGDAEQGGYFSTPPTDPSILVRIRDSYDGAEPSGNSVAAMNLLRLCQFANREAWRSQALKLLAAFTRQIESSAESLPQMAAAADFALAKPRQVVLAGRLDSPDTQTLLRVVNERYLPNKILILVDGPERREQLAPWLPFVRDLRELDGKATAYVCENYACRLPTSDPKQVEQLLDPPTGPASQP